MYRENKMIEAIRWILSLYEPKDYEAFDKDEIGEDGGLYLPDVVMVLRDRAERVYQFKLDTDIEKGFKYRSAELFNQRAILIYEENEIITCTNETTTTYNTELWLLEDMRFMIVHLVRMTHNDGVAYESEYRTVVKQLETKDDLFFSPENLIEALEEMCIPIWEMEAIIYEL